MFSDNVTKQLVAIENEQRAQKVATTLNYGALVRPANAPSQSWNGNVSNRIDDATGLDARWIATFTRTDGVNKTPFVDFPWTYTLDKYQYDDMIAVGSYQSVSGRDTHANDELKVTDGLYEIGQNYVKWKIEILGNNGTWFYVSSDGTGIHLTVQAISMVPGTLTLERAV